MSSSFDAIAGCLVGGALGDGVASRYEGLSAPIEVDRSAPLAITDDTQLTLATAEAIIEKGAVDPEAIATRYIDWFLNRRITRVGASVAKALTELAAGAHWADSGRTGERAAGTGAAMRIAPLAFFLDPSNLVDRQTIRDVARITHRNDEAYAGALAVVLAIRRASGLDRASLFETMLPDSNTRDRLRKIAILPTTTTIAEVADRFGASGYVAEAVPLAIFSASVAPAIGFERMILEIASLGGDSDTIASIAGQIAGASLGFGRLPTDLVERLPERDEIRRIAAELSRTSSRP